MKKYLVLQTNGDFKEVYEEDYSSSYEMLREYVGGCIEHVSFIEVFDKRGIDLWIHDEGKLINLLPTIALFYKEKIVEVLNGNIVFSRYGNEGETLPLTDEDIDFIKKTLTNNKGVIQYVNKFTDTTLVNLVSFIEL